MRNPQNAPTAKPDPVRFGTDGVRSVANQGPLAAIPVVRLGRAVGRLLRDEPGLFGNPLAAGLPARLRRRVTRRPGGIVLLGRDTRQSGDLLAAAMAAGLMSTGWNVVDAGVVSTPALAGLCRAHDVLLGIMLTASHNPFVDNGIKLISPEGLKVPDRAERRIERVLDLAESPVGTRPDPTGAGVGRLVVDLARAHGYAAGLVRRFRAGGGLRGLRIVIDCAHGAASALAPEVFRSLGAELTVLHARPDGTNINRGVGALHPERLARAVVRAGAHAGFAFDGDADRVMVVDETGAILDGDHVLAILGRYLAGRRRLPKRTVVSTVMHNLGLKFALEEAGVRLLVTPVGDRHVLERMLRDRLILGGEQSGHIILLDDSTTGDGVLSALRMLEVVRATRLSLSVLAGALRKFPQVLLNVPVRNKPPFDSIPEVAAAVRNAEAALAGRGRILLRYSGTESLARVMVEGEAIEPTRRLAQEIAKLVARMIG